MEDKSLGLIVTPHVSGDISCAAAGSSNCLLHTHSCAFDIYLLFVITSRNMFLTYWAGDMRMNYYEVVWSGGRSWAEQLRPSALYSSGGTKNHRNK